MNEFTSAEIYRDIKKIIKKLCLLVIGLGLIALVIFAAFQVHDHFDKKDRERNILSKALPFTTNHKPLVYTHSDFGDESELELWLIGDSDAHAIVKIGGRYSVFTTTSGNENINFYHRAGDACDYVSAYYDDGKISRVTCGNRTYSDGPWNNYK